MSIELNALFTVSDEGDFNPATKSGLKSLKEYQFLVEQVAAAARAFLALDLTKFDPNIGDCNCQIRTVKTLLLAKDSQVFAEMQLLLGQALAVQETCTAKLAPQKSKTGGKQSKENQAVLSTQNNPLKLKMSARAAYLVQAYIFSLMDVTLPQKDPFCIGGKTLPANLSLKSVVGGEARISGKRAGLISSIIRRNLSSVSLEFIREQAELSKDPVHIAACSDLCTRTVDTLFRSTPMFYSYRVLLETCRRENIPIIFKVKLYAKDLKDKQIGTEYIVLNRESSEEAAAANQSPCVCVFEGACQDTEARLQKLKEIRYGILSDEDQAKGVIYAGAADHPQYIKPSNKLKNKDNKDSDIDDEDSDTIDNIEQLEACVPEPVRLASYKQLAKKIGCAKENKSLFFIQHVYPLSRYRLEEERVKKNQISEEQDNV